MHCDLSQDLERVVMAYFKAGPRRTKNAAMVWPTCVADSHFITPRPIRDVMWRSVKNRNRLKGADIKATVADAIYLLSPLLFLARRLNKSWWHFWLALSFWWGHVRVKCFYHCSVRNRVFWDSWVHTLTEVKTTRNVYDGTSPHSDPTTPSLEWILFYRKAVSTLSSVEEREEGIVDEQVKRKTRRSETIYF